MNGDVATFSEWPLKVNDPLVVLEWRTMIGLVDNRYAALWAVLQTMKLGTPLPGKGRLLEQLPAA